MQYLRFILLTLATVVITSAERDTVYCDVAEHKFFVEQWGQCKMCDRCPTGYGVPSPKTVEVYMDPVHGALSCLGCQRCVPGKTFSNKIGFEGCQKCKNCTDEGLYEEAPCTPTLNAKCTDRIPKENMNPKQRSAEVMQISKHDKKAPDSETGYSSASYYIPALLVISITIVPALVLVSVLAKRRGRICFKPVIPEIDGEQERLNPRPTVEVVETMPTSPSSEQCCIPIDSVVGDNNASVPIVSQEELETVERVHLRNEDDLVADGELEDTVMTEQDIRSIYTELAPDNIYCELCRALGVPDNTIQIIKEEQRPNLKETAFQCLKKWLELKGRYATLREFENGLRQIRRGGLVDTLRQKNSRLK